MLCKLVSMVKVKLEVRTGCNYTNILLSLFNIFLVTTFTVPTNLQMPVTPMTYQWTAPKWFSLKPCYHNSQCWLVIPQFRVGVHDHPYHCIQSHLVLSCLIIEWSSAQECPIHPPWGYYRNWGAGWVTWMCPIVACSFRIKGQESICGYLKMCT